MSAATDRLFGGRTGLWVLAASPTIWAAHFLLSYATAAVFCAKLAGPDGSLTAVRVAIAVYTVVALAGTVYLGVRGYVQHRRAGEDIPHDDDAPESRSAFLGFATFLLSGLSTVAILYAALVALFLRTCR